MADLKLLLNSYHSGANAWFALADERGYFTDEGLTVRMTAGSGAFRAPTLMVDDGHDLTFGDMCALTGYVAQCSPGAGPAAIFVIHHSSPSAIAAPIDGSIHGPRDLEGRLILTHASDVAYRSFPAYARASGIDRAKVEIALSDDPMAAMLQTMLAGGADGVFGYISSQKAVLRQADPVLALHIRFLPFPEIVPDLYGSAMIASRPAIAGKAEELRAFLRALNRSLLDSIEDQDAAVAAVLARNAALDGVIERERWAGTIGDEMTHTETEIFGFGAVDPARLGRAVDLLAGAIPLARAPPAEELFEAAFLPLLADRLRLAEAVRHA